MQFNTLKNKDYAVAYDNNPAGENCCPERRPIGSRGDVYRDGVDQQRDQDAERHRRDEQHLPHRGEGHHLTQSWCPRRTGCNPFTFWVHHQSQGFV